jgi:hypothetical protein
VKVSGHCTDKAGNSSADVDSAAFDYDNTAPTNVATNLNRAADHNGWYNHAVDWTTTGTDATSDIDTCSTGTYSGPDGTGKKVSGHCTDKAGNSSADVDSAAFNYDGTKPTLNPAVSPNPVQLNATATATPNATDATSDIETQSCPAIPTNSVGAKSVTCSAMDNAGNTNTALANYTVVFRWDGFLQPINDTAHTGLYESKFKLGSTVPVKFQLKDVNGAAVQQATTPTFTRSANRGSCDTATTTEEYIADPAFTGTGFRWDSTSQQYIFNWSTKGLTGGEYRIYANLGDTTNHYVDICLVK